MIVQSAPPSLLDEDTLTLTKLAQELDVHTSTIWRWTTRGIDGVRLESARLGGKRITSREAVKRFSAATTAASMPYEASPVASPTRQRAIEAAEAEAERLGL